MQQSANATTKQNYVQAREAEIKAKYQAEINWNRFLNLWYLLGDTVSMERDIELLTQEYKARRAEYIKRGRKAGTTLAKAA
jgi:hypothetical protein